MRPTKLCRLASVLLLLLAAACADHVVTTGPNATSTRASLTLVSGGGQSAIAGQPLASPVVVKVVDAALGVPIPGYLVNWVVTQGGGSLFVGATETNLKGETQDYWTLGSAVGPQALEVRAISPVNGQKLTFATVTATALPTPIAQPSGTIAFMSDQTGNNEVWSVRADGSGLTQLTSGGYDNLHPVWSPDGTRIAMYSTRNGGTDIYVMNADGGGVTQLTTHAGGPNAHPTWSPDGTRIAYQCAVANTQFDLCVMNADGTNQLDITNTPYHEVDPEWSPDGTQLLFDCYLDATPSLCLIHPDGTGLRQLTSGTLNRTGSWSPDGKHIAFTSNRDGNDEIYVMNADGTGQTRLTNNAADDDFASWSPDGAHVIFASARAGGPLQLYTMNPDGTGVTRFLTFGGNDRAPSWKK